MALNIPSTRKEVEQRTKTDIQNLLTESNPFLRNSYLGAFVTATSGRVFDFYQQLTQLIKELFLDTATGEFLERWGSYVDILRKPATQASGLISISGDVGSIIPAGTQLSTQSGLLYETTQTTSIAEQTIIIDSLTRSSNTVTATTVSDHRLTTGLSITIAGADQTDYNGTFTVNVIDTTHFSYTISTTPVTPATGTITAKAPFASVNIKSIDYGDDLNLEGDTSLNITTPIAGVNGTAYVQASEVSGGADQESDEDLRDRILFRYQNPVSLFNKNAIIEKAQEVPGVTRVFVESPPTLIRTLDVLSLERGIGNFDQLVVVTTDGDHFLEDGQLISVSGADQDEYNISKKAIVIDADRFAYNIIGAPVTPATGTITVQTSIPAGQVQIYFTMDNQDNIIPSAADVQTVKEKILTIKPAHTDDNDVIVKAPTPITVNFTFTSLNPNTVTMQQAIRDNLDAFFKENTTVSESLLQVAYMAAIYRTIDPETGVSVRNFTLSTPTTDITVQSGEIPVLGTITFGF